MILQEAMRAARRYKREGILQDRLYLFGSSIEVFMYDLKPKDYLLIQLGQQHPDTRNVVVIEDTGSKLLIYSREFASGTYSYTYCEYHMRGDNVIFTDDISGEGELPIEPHYDIGAIYEGATSRLPTYRQVIKDYNSTIGYESTQKDLSKFINMCLLTAEQKQFLFNSSLTIEDVLSGKYDRSIAYQIRNILFMNWNRKIGEVFT